MWKGEERNEEMPAPITLPPFDEQLQAELHQRYEEAGDAEKRTRPRAHRHVSLGSRVGARDRTGSPCGGSRHGQLDDRGTRRLPEPTDRGDGQLGDGARVPACAWLCLQAPDLDVTTQSRRESRLRGKRLRVEVLLAGASAPEPLPVTDLVEADLWDQLPADLSALLALLPRADLYLQDEIQFAFHPTLTRVWSRKGRRGQRLIEAPGDNRKVYGFGLVDWREGWFEGRTAPGRTADVFCEQVRAAVARSKRRGRVAIVIADNLKAHTPAGSLLVRGMLTELKEQLYLVYTPAYDPDANRIEWLWRISRRVVTHNHQRSDFDLLLADVETHFQALTRTPDDVLRHIGSPFAPDKEKDATQLQTHAA